MIGELPITTIIRTSEEPKMGRFERLLWTVASWSAEAASRRLAFRPLVGRQNAKMGRVERLQWTMARKAAQAARVRQDARLGR